MKAAACGLVMLSAFNALFAGGCPPVPQVGDPLSGLTAEQLERFERGRDVFGRVFTPETGLGPLFNSNACTECHEDPVAGGAGDEFETHASLVGPDGFCDLLVDRGGPVFQTEVTPALHGALGIEREPVPPGATIATRSTPDVFGMGLLDAVPDRVILALADPDDRNRDGISGRPNFFIDGRLGRFGRKAFVPALADFNRGAFVLEQGITSPALPNEESIGGQPIPPEVDPAPDPELSEEDTGRADDFVRLLAPPPPLPLDYEGERGRTTFARIGCASCHVPSLRTGPNPVSALSYKTVEAYTDLLLHDMGAERGDMCFGQATPGEFRTEPLMGLRFMTQFMHDGKARSIEEAILLHGGEATRTIERYRRLSPASRAALLKFLKSL